MEQNADKKMGDKKMKAVLSSISLICVETDETRLVKRIASLDLDLDGCCFELDDTYFASKIELTELVTHSSQNFLWPPTTGISTDERQGY